MFMPCIGMRPKMTKKKSSTYRTHRRTWYCSKFHSLVLLLKQKKCFLYFSKKLKKKKNLTCDDIVVYALCLCHRAQDGDDLETVLETPSSHYTTLVDMRRNHGSRVGVAQDVRPSCFRVKVIKVKGKPMDQNDNNTFYCHSKRP